MENRSSLEYISDAFKAPKKTKTSVEYQPRKAKTVVKMGVKCNKCYQIKSLTGNCFCSSF